jgi:putative endonuclease
MSGGNAKVEPACRRQVSADYEGRVTARLRRTGFNPVSDAEWAVYVMRSEVDGRLYVGMTSNLERRVKEHNAGYNRSTRSWVPFEITYVGGCRSRTEARKREKFLKSGIGRQFLKTVAGSGSSEGRRYERG